MADAPDKLLTILLRDVSRSFYLTLRVLPASIRRQVGLAYLLARLTDTIADTELIAVEQRLSALQALRARIMGGPKVMLDFGQLAVHQALPAERLLLVRCEDALLLLETFSPADRQLIRDVLDTITSGQELDLRRFGTAGTGNPLALETDQELDDYTYRVAGCVGEFWTRICRAHLFPEANLDDARLLDLGVRFGKGLQMVNILRDLPADLRRGRCYLPTEKLQSLGLEPADLLGPGNESRLRPAYDFYLERAAGHLHAGWEYTNTLPAGQVRVRLACAWPVLIGLETVELLGKGAVLDPARRIKVTRGRIREILFYSIVLLPFPGRWRRLAPARKAIASKCLFP